MQIHEILKKKVELPRPLFTVLKLQLPNIEKL